jgi:hypothetical protein
MRKTKTTKPVEAVYEDGVLRPLVALNLNEHQRVMVVVTPVPAGYGGDTWLDTECLQFCAQDADESISLESVRRALSKIPGSLAADFAAERAER